MRRRRTPREKPAEGTPHGDVYLGRLIRAQLGLSLLALGAFGGLVGSLPLLFLRFPGLQEIKPLGVPLPMLILVAPLFPLIVLIGLLYQRRADALDGVRRAALFGRPGPKGGGWRRCALGAERLLGHRYGHVVGTSEQSWLTAVSSPGASASMASAAGTSALVVA